LLHFGLAREGILSFAVRESDEFNNIRQLVVRRKVRDLRSVVHRELNQSPSRKLPPRSFFLDMEVHSARVFTINIDSCLLCTDVYIRFSLSVCGADAGGLSQPQTHTLKYATAAIHRALSTDGPVVVDAIVDPHEPPMPPKTTVKQALHYAEALAKGTHILLLQ
jgi:hypothetical protein